ncbi:MAG TPA: HEAT repeat domain-containing protein [Chthoniobacteraceae bacterium]|jgi:hypothetical protein
MKTIVIRPEFVIGFDNTALREAPKPRNKVAIVSLALIPIVAIASWAAGRSTASQTTAPAVAAVAPVLFARPVAAAPAIDLAANAASSLATDGSIDLQTAVEKGLVQAEFQGNGREQLTATVFNPAASAITLKISLGQLLESGANAIVVVRNVEATIAPGQTSTIPVESAAIRSGNTVAPASFRLSFKTAPKIDLLLSYAQDHPELSAPALQTAILALTENLPLSAVCKFTPTGGFLPSSFDTAAFRVETVEILAALSALRELGVKDRNLAMTVDPQLKVESMIEPLCRAKAARYFGINATSEWEYWKNELLHGEPGTRHYALFGIARFYPDTALDMLPNWAREKRTAQPFRLAAVQALGDTQRPEALPILHQLVKELGRNTELGRAALDAALYLDTHLTRVATNQAAIAFRSAPPQF